MHAASVHPEPGSNSRYLLYYLAHGFPFRLITSSLSSLALSFLPIFLELCSLLKVLRDPFAHILPYMLVLLLLLFSFQGSTLPPHRAARLLYHFPTLLSTPFFNFFGFFLFFAILSEKGAGFAPFYRYFRSKYGSTKQLVGQILSLRGIEDSIFDRKTPVSGSDRDVPCQKLTSGKCSRSDLGYIFADVQGLQ